MSTPQPRPELLVSTDWLERHLDDPELRIFDATAHMISQPVGPSIVKSARADWALGHIPNSAYLSMVDDLCASGQAKPYAFPDARQVSESLNRLGVTQRSRIVLYGAGQTAAITRVWWVLRAYGVERVSILDGGWPKWLREGRPVSTDHRVLPLGDITATLQPGRLADRHQVLAAIEEPGVSIVNALSAEQHHGTGGSTFGRTGRIAGSVNVPNKELIDPLSGQWLAPEILQRKFEEAGVLAAEQVIAYCGGGVGATVDAFALEMLGHGRVAVYEGSLLDWCSFPELPMETG